MAGSDAALNGPAGTLAPANPVTSSFRGAPYFGVSRRRARVFRAPVGPFHGCPPATQPRAGRCASRLPALPSQCVAKKKKQQEKKRKKEILACSCATRVWLGSLAVLPAFELDQTKPRKKEWLAVAGHVGTCVASTLANKERNEKSK